MTDAFLFALLLLQQTENPIIVVRAPSDFQDDDHENGANQKNDLIHSDEITNLKAPFTLAEAGEFWDGGTVWVQLSDASNTKFLLCVFSGCL